MKKNERFFSTLLAIGLILFCAWHLFSCAVVVPLPAGGVPRGEDHDFIVRAVESLDQANTQP